MLRRTNMKRNTPLKRTPMKRKRRKGDEPEIRHAYIELHSTCAVCHAGWKEFDNWLEVHHLAGGWGRKDEVGNLLTLCRDCHERYHRGSGLTAGNLLAAKRDSDPENFGIDLILLLSGKKGVPERWGAIELPQWAIDARMKR